MQLEKAAPVEIRSLGLSEKWLQERISEDPSLLGLGDLEVVSREHRQPVGGRIDFLMRKIEADTYYEVEIMLGAVDESHIIRTIEYWDIERQRRPNSEHRAVIVAEQITTRFFNVIRLLNRAVPLIAVKLSAFKMADKIVLHPITVLDVMEESSDPYSLDPIESTDRGYWEKRSPSLLSMMDQITGKLKSDGLELNATYNKHHVAIGTTGRNFLWFNPRKAPSTCHIEFRSTSDIRDVLLSSLQAAGIDASPRETEFITYSITMQKLEQALPVVADTLIQAERTSR